MSAPASPSQGLQALPAGTTSPDQAADPESGEQSAVQQPSSTVLLPPGLPCGKVANENLSPLNPPTSTTSDPSITNGTLGPQVTANVPGNVGRDLLQQPLRSNYLSSPGCPVSAPPPPRSMFPRINSLGLPSQQPPPIVKMTPQVPPTALQPPVPRQSLGMRPSFSYNIVSHANVNHAPGQQFQPATMASQPHPQGEMHHASAFSAQTSASEQYSGSHPGMTGAQRLQSTSLLSMPRPIATPNFSFGGSSRPLIADSLQKRVASNSNITAAAIAVQTPASTSSSSASSTGASPHLNPTSVVRPVGQPFPGLSGTPMPSLLPSAPSPSTVAIRPMPPDSFSASQRPALPSSSPAPQNAASFPAQQLMYQPYSSGPAPAPSPSFWVPPHQPGCMQRPPFAPYTSAVSSTFSQPMGNVPLPSLPTTQSSSVSIVNPQSGTVPTALNSDNVKQPDPINTSDGGTTKKEDADAWTSHRTEAGVIYYYNSVTGVSTYEKPSSFKVEPDKVTTQPTPVFWEKLPGTDWSLVTTNDGKKYYYDSKNKVSSWQIPPEVSEIRNTQENSATKTLVNLNQNSSLATDKDHDVGGLYAPAHQSGGRDAISLRTPGTSISSSALDLVKKKLQDAGAPMTSTALPSPITAVSNSSSPKLVEATMKTHSSDNNKEKLKDSNGDGNFSESSSDSEDTDSGPSKEKCIVQFKEMLRERGIAPFSKWEKELPKIIFDARFKAVPGNDARRSIFEHYVRTRAEEERKEKRAAQKAANEGFKLLLDEASEVIEKRADYQYFKRKWGNDPRFGALDRKERELLFNERALSLKKAAEEKMHATRAVVASNFKSMLRENDITLGSRWSRVKDGLRNDPRYKAAKHDEREPFFNEYLNELKTAEDEAERVAKSKKEELEKLKRREQEMRKRKQREEQEMESLRLKVRRKESEASYQALLVEMIKDPKASWSESKPKLEKDPQGRFINSDLEPSELEKLFRDHVKNLYDRCVHDFRDLLAEVITQEAASKVTGDEKTVFTSWSEAKCLLKPDPRYTRISSKDRESLWLRYAEDVKRKMSPKGKEDTEGKVKSSSDHAGRSPRSHRRR